MQTRAILLSVKTYDFENDKHERVNGAKISYILPSKVNQDGQVGFPPIQANLKQGVFGQILSVPAVYDFDFEAVPGKNNKLEMVLSSLTYIEDFQINVSE